MADENQLTLCTVGPGLNTNGGVPYVTRNVLSELAKRGVDCHVITDQNVDPDISAPVDDRVTQHQLDKGSSTWSGCSTRTGIFALDALKALLTISKSHTFDAVYVPGYFLFPILLARAFKTGSFQETPVIGASHGTYLRLLRSTNTLPSFSGKYAYISKLYADHLLTKHSLRSSDFVHAVSLNTKQELSELGISSEKIRVISNAIDVDAFQAEPSINVHEKHGIFGDPLILSVGTVEPRKGIHTLIEAVPTLKRRFPDVEIVIVGSRPYPGYTDYLRDRIQSLNITDSVTLVGRVPRAELLGWYEASDTLVSASYSEGGPISVLEAAAGSTSVVTTDVGCAREVLGKYGRYIASGQPKSLADGVQEAVETGLGAKLEARVRRKFSWADRGDELYSLFMGVAQ